MCVPTNFQAIINSVELARRNPPFAGDAGFEPLRKAEIGQPILIKNADRQAECWLVPLGTGERACGFAMLDLNGNLLRMGYFGSGATDVASHPPMRFFIEPPLEIMEEIAHRYAPAQLMTPEFSYDGNPVKWGWRINVLQKKNQWVTVFIQSGGWYSRDQREQNQSLEG